MESPRSILRLKGGGAAATASPSTAEDILAAANDAAKSTAEVAPRVPKELAPPKMMPWYQQPDDDWEKKDGCEVVRWDSSLEGFKGALQHRYGRYKTLKRSIINAEGSLENFARGYTKFGVRRSTDPKKPGIIASEWAPNAKWMALFGDFNNWNRGQYPYTRDEYGTWR
eukprot:CAMPEP_0113723434 /NCGR_PEP_ID=MMETSP0038_2-20120614/38421_1 /TAXON_ID=2898 /ORGANISM="Cryptomonas paramecium" /LENGTH=168 /DNA_ID=CAMNT_0000653023 /DNA_START=297 /DNA_END=799 /DNA_ORIENTATION=+ /assembly_acc=CAM_ASM_000170